jgi:hypothetical protein
MDKFTIPAAGQHASASPERPRMVYRVDGDALLLAQLRYQY